MNPAAGRAAGQGGRPPIGVTIVGTGSALPEGVITNQDLEKVMDTSDEWIIQRTGIRTRHRNRSVISKFQKVKVAGDDDVRFDGNSVDQSTADQFTQQPWPKRFAKQDFLRAIGPDRGCTLEFQRPSVLIGDQQASDMTATFDFHGFHEAQTKQVGFPGP